MRITINIFCIIFFLLLTSCKDNKQNINLQYSKQNTDTTVLQSYTLAIHPLHNPELLTKLYLPLIEFINDSLRTIHLSLETSKDYPSFEEKYRAKKPDFIMPNPFETIDAMQYDYTVMCIAGSREYFKGLIIVRKDSSITKVSDLIGKKVCYPAQTALAACIMPQYFLFKNGINVTRDIENIFVGSQESSIMNVYLGIVSAGSTWTVPWKIFNKQNPEVSDKLRVAWETTPQISNSFMYRNDIPITNVQRIRSILLGLNTSVSGKLILDNTGIDRFTSGTNNDYDSVKIFINDFEKNVRKIAAN